MGFVARVCQPSTLRMLIWPEASSAQNSMAAVSADGNTVCVLILRLNSSCSRSIAFVTGMRITVPVHPARTALVLAYGVTIRDEGHREHVSGQADSYDEPRARVSSWPPLRPTRLRRERGSVVVVWPTAPVKPQERGAGDATRDRHGHPPHFRGGGFLGGRSAPVGRAGRYDPLGA